MSYLPPVSTTLAVPVAKFSPGVICWGQICCRCHCYRWCTLTCEDLLESLKIFETTLILFSGTLGKMIHEKTWHCPFNNVCTGCVLVQWFNAEIEDIPNFKTKVMYFPVTLVTFVLVDGFQDGFSKFRIIIVKIYILIWYFWAIFEHYSIRMVSRAYVETILLHTEHMRKRFHHRLSPRRTNFRACSASC